MNVPRACLIITALAIQPSAAAQNVGKPIVAGLTNPKAAAVGAGGKLFVAVEGGNGAAAIQLIDHDKAVPFSVGFMDPGGLAVFQKWLFVSEKQRIQRLDANGKVDVFVEPTAFPTEPRSLGAMAVDSQSGTLYICDTGDQHGKGCAIFSISPQKRVKVILDAKRLPTLRTPSGLAMDGASQFLLLDGGAGELHRVRISDGATERLADGLAGCEGLVWDPWGRLVIGDPKVGRLLVISRPGEKPVPMASGLAAATGFCLSPSGKEIVVPDRQGGTLTSVPIAVPGAEINEQPMAIETETAFGDLRWTGWNADGGSGKADPLRPILLTHAGDGSDRVFVATQQGVIHVFANDPRAKQTTIFLDLHEKVAFNEKTPEEGFLGLAFHPRFNQNGEFFVFYTSKNLKLTNVVSRFKVRREDPSRAEASSEEEVLRFNKVASNHDGGTICFGPDGYLYIAHGDGGLQGDPYENGQNLQSLLGKVLRIDVDRKENGKNYSVSPDNPFVGRTDARPEIWAYGLRNVWRMAFDHQTGVLWAGDVGESLFEEIDLIRRGGNFGWNRREGLHPFGAKGSGPAKEFIDPIWEYRHDLGACIIGGCVYRGKRLPELRGYYLYADYTNGKLWALRYDPKQGRVVENRVIADRQRPVWSFGEDEQGEVYLLSAASDRRGILRYARQGEKK